MPMAATRPCASSPPTPPGLRQLVAWLREQDVTTVALEATGAYGHVLFLTLLEAGCDVVTTAPTFTRQIKGRPKTDRRDCQWIHPRETTAADAQNSGSTRPSLRGNARSRWSRRCASGEIPRAWKIVAWRSFGPQG